MTVTDRLTQVQAALELAGLDALLVAAPPNVAYVSGFRAEPHERLIALVVPRDGRPRLVCPSLEEGAARAAVAGRVDLRVWRDERRRAGRCARARAWRCRRARRYREGLPLRRQCRTRRVGRACRDVHGL
jgi:Xaa-Pro aminopeptidase